MNILYVSFFSGTPGSGPAYSVPKQIEAQAEIDNVFWYSMEKSELPHWRIHMPYHNLVDYPSGRLKDLPSPFNNPDFVVFEGFYYSGSTRIINDVIDQKVPYVFVPRCSLTKQAQKRKKLKKVIANTIKYRRYSKSAVAIHYLTKQEWIDSGSKWNENTIILPNGIDKKENVKTEFSSSRIRCITIGRIETYQKGLDILIDACAQIKGELREEKCSFCIYGPEQDGNTSDLKKKIEQYGIEDIVSVNGAIYGAEKEEKLLESDVFIMTSRFEGHPMSLIEALAYGLPCLVTTGSNMRDEIDRFGAGWTCDTDINDVARAIKEMIKDKDKLVEKSKNAVALAEEYDWKSIAIRSHEEYCKYGKVKK